MTPAWLTGTVPACKASQGGRLREHSWAWCVELEDLVVRDPGSWASGVGQQRPSELVLPRSCGGLRLCTCTFNLLTATRSLASDPACSGPEMEPAVQSIEQAEHMDKLGPLRTSMPSTARFAEAPGSPSVPAARAAPAAVAAQQSVGKLLAAARGGKVEQPCSPQSSGLAEVSPEPCILYAKD